MEVCRNPEITPRWQKELSERKHPSPKAKSRREPLFEDPGPTPLESPLVDTPPFLEHDCDPLRANEPVAKVSFKGDSTLRIEGLDLSECCLQGEERTKLINLLNEYEDVFSKNKQPGLISDVKFHIDTGDHAPFQDKSRYLPPERYEALRKIIKKMLVEGIIRPSSSPWASAIVMVPKDGTDWRLCIDFRRLNELTRSDAYPLPRMADLLSCYRDADVCSSLDLTAGYWQIPMAPEDISKTAFICPARTIRMVENAVWRQKRRRDIPTCDG